MSQSKRKYNKSGRKRSYATLRERVIKIEDGVVYATLPEVNSINDITVKISERHLSNPEVADVCWKVYTTGINGQKRVGRTISTDETRSGKTTLYLARAICGTEKGLFIDHINHDTLDNTDENLRPCTNSQNQMNRAGATVYSSTGILGVQFSEKRQVFYAVINKDGKRINLGTFATAEEALRARIAGEQEIFGEFAPNREAMK